MSVATDLAVRIVGRSSALARSRVSFIHAAVIPSARPILAAGVARTRRRFAGSRVETSRVACIRLWRKAFAELAIPSISYTGGRQHATMNTRRDYRRSSLFDSLEEGGMRPAPSYSTSEIAEQENERGIDGLQDRVSVLKRLTSDIHDEVDTHNRLLERMEQDMDASRGMLSGTMDRFTRVFETKSGRSIMTIVGSMVIVFLLVYYLTK